MIGSKKPTKYYNNANDTGLILVFAAKLVELFKDSKPRIYGLPPTRSGVSKTVI